MMSLYVDSSASEGLQESGNSIEKSIECKAWVNRASSAIRAKDVDNSSGIYDCQRSGRSGAWQSQQRIATIAFNSIDRSFHSELLFEDDRIRSVYWITALYNRFHKPCENTVKPLEGKRFVKITQDG